MNSADLDAYLASLERDSAYRVIRTLKQSDFETTQIVVLEHGRATRPDAYATETDGESAAEQGTADANGTDAPRRFIRKRIARDAGIGSAYQRIFEAQAAGKRFGHIPHIRECFATENTLVVVLDYIEGVTLQDTVLELGPSTNVALWAFPQLCDAVTCLHTQFDPPIIHRDLKPSNVIVRAKDASAERSGDLVLIDFGIARAVKEGADSDTRQFGTREYAPPEQFGFKQTDERSDVYALGMLLYFCLTGEKPNAGLHDSGFADDRILPQLRPVLLKTTEFDSKARYSSVGELKAAFLDAARTGAKEAGGARSGAVEIGAARTGAKEAGGARNDSAKAAPDARTAAEPDAGNGSEPGAGTAVADNDAASTAPAPLRRRFRIAGTAWNAVLLLAFLVVFAGSAAAVVKPAPEIAQYPTWLRIAVYLCTFVIPAAILGYLLSDRRPIKRRVAFLRKLTTKQEVIGGIAIIAMCCGFALTCFLVFLAP